MPQVRNTHQTFLDKCFRGTNGTVQIIQMPNLPLIVWLIAKLFGLVSSGVVERLSAAVAFGALFTWAWLELFGGVNYFRRLLGCIVLVVLLVPKI